MVRAIRQGLVMTIPLLMIGSFALAFRHLPVQVYQTFLTNFAGGLLIHLFTVINQATFGILSLFMVITISYSYAKPKLTRKGLVMGAIFVALSVNMVLNGILTDSFQITSLGTQGMFTAIFSAMLGSYVYCKVVSSKVFTFQFYTMGADTDFNDIISSIFPAIITIFVAFVLNEVLIIFLHTTSFEALFHDTVFHLFEMVTNRFLRTLLFVLLTSVFWFFGIHGTNVLESVALTLFSGNVEPGGALVAEILNKPFMDAFVFMGGCGATLSLVFAILLFSKQKNIKNLAKMSFFPMLFNINELMVFGLPIIWNWSFFVPFVSVPVICMLISYAAISIGIVPMPVTSITWVTPVIIGGYTTTGSVAGSLLQVFNIAVSALIYGWFLKRYERRTNEKMQENLRNLMKILQDAEENGTSVNLLELDGEEGNIAKILAEDLRYILKTDDDFELFYQPQYNDKDEFFGAEALLRWNHPRCGYMYPPLLIGIAKESGQLQELEEAVFKRTCADIKTMQENGVPIKHISVNATAFALQTPSFVTFLQETVANNPHVKNVMCIELTEQMSFLMREDAEDALKIIHDMGILFAIDDFSMGHTSLKYLQSNLFSFVKLDGSLTKNIVKNKRSREIVASIAKLSQTMDFEVIAEYVETEDQKLILEELGCKLYQGYLYSPAIRLEELIAKFEVEEQAPGK